MTDRSPAEDERSPAEDERSSAEAPSAEDGGQPSADDAPTPSAGGAPSLASPFWRLDAALIAGGVLLLVAYRLGIGGPLVGGDVTAIGRIGVYAFLVGSSSPVVAAGLRYFTGDALKGGGDIDEDTGWLIGKLENVLVVTFVFQGAFTALSIVFAAKSFIRREDTSSGNTTYYVAGTLLNFTYSVVVGLVAVRALGL